MKFRTALGALAASALLLTGCAAAEGGDSGGGDSGAGEEAELVYVGAAAVPGSTQIGMWAVPDELGFFEEEGLTVTQELADGSTAAIQVVASGSADYTNAGVVSIMAAVNTGVPVQGYGAIAQNYPWVLAVGADSDIEDPEDFAGKTVGIISLASESNAFARAWMSENGLDPDSDVTFVPVGAGAPALAALDNGDIDALALYTEMYAALENGGAEFRYFDNPALFDEMPSIALTASADVINSDSDVLARAARAIYKGLLFSYANPEAAVRIGYEYYPEKLPESGDPEENIENDTRTFSAWIASVMPEEGDPLEWGDFGVIEPDVLQGVQDFAIASGNLEQEVDLEKVWTDKYVEQMNDFDRQEVLDLAASWTPED
ncbi:ABC transporter substrate-binding protein [Microbacterium sp. 179-I 3D2 NHS]|uniref:ABC transporter substrate-binding protein n=1 Tax=Microbacterium sp. 179-I 3D2 NHS TaxID=3235178 RepID=UPI0039A099C5